MTTEQENPRGGPAPDDPKLETTEDAIPEGAALGTDLQEVEAAAEPISFIDTVVGVFRKAATPQPKPTALDTSEDSVLPDTSGPEIAAEIGRLVDSLTQRVTVAPADSISTVATELAATTTPVQIIGAQPDRLRITVKNKDAANPVFLSGQRETATTGLGHSLAAGESLTLQYRGELWAAAPSGASVSMLVEYGDGS